MTVIAIGSRSILGQSKTIDYLNDDFSTLTEKDWVNLDIFQLLYTNIRQLSLHLLKHVQYSITKDEAESIIYTELQPILANRFFAKQKTAKIPPSERRRAVFGYMLRVISSRIREKTNLTYASISTHMMQKHHSDPKISVIIQEALVISASTPLEIDLVTNPSEVFMLSDDEPEDSTRVQLQHELLESVRTQFRTKTMDCLRLRVINGYNTTQISEMLNEDITSVYRRLRLARETLANFCKNTELESFAQSLIIQDDPLEA